MRLSAEINDILMANCETILLKNVYETPQVRTWPTGSVGDLFLGRIVDPFERSIRPVRIVGMTGQ